MSHQEHKDDTGAKLGMWLFLFTELLLFGGLFILYAVYLARYPHEFGLAGRELNVTFGAANTLVLLTSSLLAAMAVTSVKRGQRGLTIGLLSGTLGCAAIFMVIKYLEWTAKFHHGIYPGSPRLVSGPPGESVFFGLYYVTTGLHGVHVLVGGALLGWIGTRVRSGKITTGDNVLLENGTLYWHLVDLIWIFIFPLYLASQGASHDIGIRRAHRELQEAGRRVGGAAGPHRGDRADHPRGPRRRQGLGRPGNRLA